MPVAQGIGRSIALRLAEDGFDVIVNDLAQNLKALEALCVQIRTIAVKASAQLEPPRCEMYIADVSCEEEVKGMMESVAAEFDGLDVVRPSFQFSSRIVS